VCPEWFLCQQEVCACSDSNLIWFTTICTSIPPLAPPTPTEVTPQFTSASNVRVTWQWTSSGPAPNCFNTTSVTYHPEGGSESSLQLRDPTATAANLTDLQNNTCNSTNSTITVVATAGRYEKKGITFLLLQGIY